MPQADRWRLASAALCQPISVWQSVLCDPIGTCPMVTSVRPLVAGNWKMNGLRGSSAELSKIIAGSRDTAARTDLMVCPPATLLASFAAAAQGSKIAIGAQDCHPEPAGAFTGD